MQHGPQLVSHPAAFGSAVACARTLSQPATFTNPLLPVGPDPWVIFHDGFYYYMNSTQGNLTIRKTRDITGLDHAQKQVVWTPPATGPYSHEIWAPELHRLDGKWYIYFAADDGSNDHHRIYVLENGAADPIEGSWTFKGKVADPSDKWAIDATVFTLRGRNYLVWSGWQGDTNGVQSLYIARLKNPWTIEGQRVRLSTPDHPWEKVGDFGWNGKVLAPAACRRQRRSGDSAARRPDFSGLLRERLLDQLLRTRHGQPAPRRRSHECNGLDQVGPPGLLAESRGPRLRHRP